MFDSAHKKIHVLNTILVRFLMAFFVKNKTFLGQKWELI